MVAATSLVAGGLTWKFISAQTAEPLRPVVSVSPSDSPPSVPLVPPAPPELAVRTSLDAWMQVTRRGDVAAQMAFYPDVVPVFYTWRRVPRHAVLAEKQKVLGEAWTLDIRMGPPTIHVTMDGDTTVTRFRKAYVIEGPRVRRRGTVIQELRWTRTEAGWKITSERDTAVLAASPRRGVRAAGVDAGITSRGAVTRDISVAGQSNAP